MAMPKQSELNRQFLEIAAIASNSLSTGQFVERLASHFSLTESDLSERYTWQSSGGTKFRHKATWTASCLKRAGLIHSPRQAHFQITAEGRKFIQTHTGEITQSQLQKLTDEQQQGDTTYSSDSPTVVDNTDAIEATPYDIIEAAYRQLQTQIADNILDSIKSVEPYRFEQLVVDLLEKMGYGEGRQVGGSGDGGIDGIINQDPLGLEKVYIQAKRWEGQVGTPPIYSFAGSLEARGANKGVFITTSSFSSTAKQTAQNISAGGKFIRLIDGLELSRLMIDHGVGVVPETTYVIKKLDENYFADEA